MHSKMGNSFGVSLVSAFNSFLLSAVPHRLLSRRLWGMESAPECGKGVTANDGATGLAIRAFGIYGNHTDLGCA
jgi:hypothetical protein